MFCTKCGQHNEEGNRFCQHCGQEAAALAAPSPMNIGEPARVTVTSMAIAPVAYAGFWLRAAAYFLDGLIIGIPVGAVLLFLVFMAGGFHMLLRRRHPYETAFVPMAAPFLLLFFSAIIVLFGLQWLYFAGLESSSRQATLGKSAMSLKVTDLAGNRLSFGRATGRFFAKIVSGMIPLALGYIMAGFTEKKQALHDMIAGTLVLRK
jgi:uncharacterized RDD family membrane protein YckC